jgi:hypothetical protein
MRRFRVGRVLALVVFSSVSSFQILAGVVPRHAEAVDCPVHKHVEASTADYVYRRGMETIDDNLNFQGLETGSSISNQCDRVASIGNVFDVSNQVELGWLATIFTGTCAPATNDFYRLATWTIAGQFGCLNSNPPQLALSHFYSRAFSEKQGPQAPGNIIGTTCPSEQRPSVKPLPGRLRRTRSG